MSEHNDRILERMQGVKAQPMTPADYADPRNPNVRNDNILRAVIGDLDTPPDEYLDPTPEILDDPLFNAIWNAIKGWDISRHNNGLYSGPTGNDARHIYEAIKRAQR